MDPRPPTQNCQTQGRIIVVASKGVWNITFWERVYTTQCCSSLLRHMLDFFCWFIIAMGRSTDLKINREHAGSLQNLQLDSNFQIKLLIKCASFSCPSFHQKPIQLFVADSRSLFSRLPGCLLELSLESDLYYQSDSLLCSVSFSVWMEI